MNRAIGSMSAVAALSKELQFTCDSEDVKAIKEHIGKSADKYDAFFVGVENGDYTEIWGIVGIIPYNTKLTRRLL